MVFTVLRTFFFWLKFRIVGLWFYVLKFRFRLLVQVYILGFRSSLGSKSTLWDLGYRIKLKESLRFMFA